jgi:hypothetical protein
MARLTYSATKGLLMLTKISTIAIFICFYVAVLSVHIAFTEGFDKEKTIDAAVDWGNGKAYIFKDTHRMSSPNMVYLKRE